MNAPPPKLLPAGPMARRLGVTARWLREEAEAGRVPALQAERRFLFNPAAVEQALAERAATNAEAREVAGAR